MVIGRRVQVDSGGLTAAHGVWVAGNVAAVTAGIMQAASSRVTAAAAINAQTTAEDTARAVEARRDEHETVRKPGDGSRGVRRDLATGGSSSDMVKRVREAAGYD